MKKEVFIIAKKNKLVYHPDVKDDLKDIPREYLEELKQHLEKLKSNPFLGIPLENKNGKDLRGCYKIFFGEAKYRIVHKPTRSGTEIVYVSNAQEEYTSVILAIGKRANEEVYDKAFNRK
ncbi:MAG: type II toxin-antitoxin system RelE/ParE family toxin [Romboutsia timonensis]|uniref:type II toxin-antitoxin system RelE family toxin n=1 Tax=Romboutsia timonensis TaxID=1776391 RepID=UPI002A762A2E|nr:type II toxin-antitoxin system RelE/ParE family toxin [Romboutsia timonensis]MDY2882193.1 type II toxin-antitoxin system RelE/ParE family toxin [Romboutsia timonensis]